MTVEQALAYINSIAADPSSVDQAQLAMALQVLAPVVEASPDTTGPEHTAFNTGLQIAQSLGLLPPPGATSTAAQGSVAPSATGVNPNQAPPTSIPAATSAGPPPPAGAVPGPGAGAVLSATGAPSLAPEEEDEETFTPSFAERGLSPSGEGPIGVQPGYSVAPAIDPRQSPEGARAAGQMATAIRPRYFNGDEAIPSTLDPIEIRRLQRELERAGLLTKDSYIPGFWDTASQTGYITAMGYANQAGKSVDLIIKQLASMPKPPEPTEEEQRQIRQFVPSDMATLAQRVKSEFRQSLGREPFPEEVRAMAAALGGFEELAFDTETQTMEGQMEALEEAMKGPAIGGSQVLPGSPTAGPQIPEGETDESPFINLPDAAAAVDPVARFLELFDQKYGPERARNKAVDETARQYNNVMQSITTMQGLFS